MRNPDESAQEDNQDSKDMQGCLQRRDDSAIQISFAGKENSDCCEDGDNGHVIWPDTEKWKMVFLFHNTAKVQESPCNPVAISRKVPPLAFSATVQQGASQ